MKTNLKVNIGKLKLSNPVMAASGTFGSEYGKFIDMNSLGAIVTKTITLKPRMGNPSPRVAETASGMLNSIGLENKGLDNFIDEKLPLFKNVKAPLIASISGDNEAEFEILAKSLSKIKMIRALELNLSCPNIKHGDRLGLIAQDEEATHRIVRSVRRVTGMTLIVKLAPNVTDIAKIARAAESAGADAVVIVNTFQAMAVDIKTRLPKLGNITGGLSGPAIKPIALKLVWDAYNNIKIPVIGVGGIMDYEDAIEFIICGATAVQVGTANFVNPKASVEIVNGISKYLTANKIGDINKLRGGLKVYE